MLYVDNLRWVVILLVISMHAADTYSPFGNWYFVERLPMHGATLLFFAAWQMYLQAFFMGLLFFLAGIFSPGSLALKGRGQFVKKRAIRLGGPVVFYMFVLGPVIEYYVAKSWTSTKRTTFWRQWLEHIHNGQFLQENGPLWFCLALLIFSLIYALVSKYVSQPRLPEKAPGSLLMITFAMLMATLTFLVRLARPRPFLNMHLGDFPQYILMFSAGVAAGRGKWLRSLPTSRGAAWLAWSLGIGVPFWLLIVWLGGEAARDTMAYSGGWYWQSAAVNLWESFTCVGMSAGLIVIFRAHFNFRNAATGFLADNSFSVYVFHPLILIVVARQLVPVPLYPILKFSVLAALSAVTTFGASAGIFRRIPLLKEIL